MCRLIAVLMLSAVLPVAVAAPAIYPIDRAEMLAGARFDLRIDFDGVIGADDYTATLDGHPLAAGFAASPRFIDRQPDSDDPARAKDFSSLRLDGVSLRTPGVHRLEVRVRGEPPASVEWTVYRPGPPKGRPKAKNVILFIGDGMTVANRTAARILAGGIKEGKYTGHLSFDDFPATALIGTSSVDSIATDSANSMSAYTTGHKASVNALGVYASRSVDPLDHPRVETIGELVKRATKKSVGIVTDAEVEDATPAGMFAHVRHRAEYSAIVDQFLVSGVDVLMGGGRTTFLPRTAPLVIQALDSDEKRRRHDGRDVIGEFHSRGYVYADTATALADAARAPSTRKLLGLFHEGNLDGALDRHVLHAGTVAQFPEQPDLTQMTRDALTVLSRNKEGFFLMVEAGLIDKFSHKLDGERSVYDTILLSNAVRVARDWAKANGNDTLIIVTPDHTHPMSLVGDIDENATGPIQDEDTDLGRDKVGTYANAKFPNYPQGTDGYPSNVLPSRHLAIVYGAHPDYYETYAPKLDGPNDPVTCTRPDPANAKGCLVYGANPRYEDAPRAQLMPGNLPRAAAAGVHAVDDGVLSAMGPGADAFHGFMENTEVFKAMVTALGIAPGGPVSATPKR